MNIAQHRRDRHRAATTTATLVCGLGLAGALSPAVEHALGAALLTLAALAVLVLIVRTAARMLRERCEDRADAVTAAAWRAEHMPHLAALLDGQHQHGQDQHGQDQHGQEPQHGHGTRAGVA